MEPIIEPLNGGLVTNRDPSLLQPGELQQAENVFLIPGSAAIHKAPGRTLFGTVTNTIDGLGLADFDTAADQIIAVGAGSFYKFGVGTQGTPTSFATDAGPSLEVISTLNKALLLTGANNNRVMLADGTSRPHGLAPITTAPGLAHSAAGGVWPLGSTQLGWFEYWTTEVYKSGDDPTAENYDEVESTFNGTPATVNVSATTSYVTITRPATTNLEATHWRLYRSERKGSATDSAFPVGYRIAEVPISTSSFNDGLTTAGAFVLPPTVERITSSNGILSPIPLNANGSRVYVDWAADFADITANDDNTTTSGDVYVDTTTFEEAQAGQITKIYNSGLICRGFNFGAVSSPISEIQVRVEGLVTGSAQLVAYLSWNGGVNWTQGKAFPLTTGSSTVTIENAGQWGRTWNADEFATANFRLALVAFGPHSTSPVTGNNITLDYAAVSINHSGTTATPIDLFPSIQLRVGSEHILVGANGEPPRASTGALFQGSILMNDLDAPTNVAWTLPGTIDYVPILYRLALEAEVRCIRTLGSAAIIGCDKKCYRMNFLPVAEDPEFNTGRAFDTFDSDDGIMSHRAAVQFILNGHPLLFYVGSTALKMTNAYETQTATDDIQWNTLVNREHLNKCFVENNTIHHELLVYFPAAGSATVNKILRLQYHPSHLKNGKLKIAGISDFSATAATSAFYKNERLILTASGSSIYVENRGFSDAAGGTIIPKIRTREIHLNGIGGTWELPRFGIHHQGGGSSITTEMTSILSNYPAVTTPAASTDLPFRTMSQIDNSAAGDGIDITITGEDDNQPIDLDYLVLFPFAESESTPLKQ